MQSIKCMQQTPAKRHLAPSQLFPHFTRISQGCEVGAHLRNLLGGADHLGAALEILQHLLHGQIDATSQVHRVHAGGH